MQQRDTFLDFCKGAAIFLVVLGHVLLKSMDLRNGLFNFICLYHMPFFFMISGLLYRQKGLMNELKGSVFSLVLPYLIYNFLYISNTLLLSSVFIDSGEFIPYLFNIFSIVSFSVIVGK